MKTSPVAWLCMNKKSESLFALTQEQLNELGYSNISMPEFEKVAPLYCYEPSAKLWLWKNFVDGKPEYWAFDNPYPTNLDNGDPQTLGQPCGYAIFKPSRDGSCGRTEEQVLSEMKSVTAPPQQPEPEPVACPYCHYSHTLGAVFFDQNCAGCVKRMTAPPQREWQGLMDEEISNIWGEPVKYMYSGHYNAIRAIEAKLKEKNS